jgi:vacuolar-type H+-ATPase subunit I/STV1
MSTTVGEAERFESVVDYLRENNIITFEDFEERLDAMGKDTFSEKEELRKVKSQIRSIEGILEHGDLREKPESYS